MTAVLIILAAVLVLVMAMSLARPVRARRRVIVERPVRRRVVEEPVVRETVVEEAPGTVRRYEE